MSERAKKQTIKLNLIHISLEGLVCMTQNHVYLVLQQGISMGIQHTT
jgi:hypothetical protein